ncbi:hypothetical protein FrEUN1fDRAFT_0742 [Parafrankia sp. EUN1f]|nr:hypothetical protein FrEUN1fDRAFT_0742 [Parafrankia sp. EUN1f]
MRWVATRPGGGGGTEGGGRGRQAVLFAVVNRLGLVTEHRRAERALVAVGFGPRFVRVGPVRVNVAIGSLRTGRRSERVRLHGQAGVHRQQPEQDG